MQALRSSGTTGSVAKLDLMDRKSGRFAHVGGDEVDSEGLAERHGRGGGGEEHGAEGKVLLEEAEGAERVFDGAKTGPELDADAQNEAIEGRGVGRVVHVARGAEEERPGVELGCAEDGEVAWSEGKAGEKPEELKRKREIGWFGEVK